MTARTRARGCGGWLSPGGRAAAGGPAVVRSPARRLDWHLRPDQLMASWRKVLSRKGVVMEEYCQLLEFETSGSTVTGVKTVKGNFKADAFVLATGAWAPLTIKQLKLDMFRED